jgi:hypothetical protein
VSECASGVHIGGRSHGSGIGIGQHDEWMGWTSKF